MIFYRDKVAIVRDRRNAARYDVAQQEPETFYGLPSEIKFCMSCVMSNQRPNSVIEFQHTAESKKETIRFDEVGLCDACRVAEQKQKEITIEYYTKTNKK